MLWLTDHEKRNKDTHIYIISSICNSHPYHSVDLRSHSSASHLLFSFFSDCWRRLTARQLKRLSLLYLLHKVNTSQWLSTIISWHALYNTLKKARDSKHLLMAFSAFLVQYTNFLWLFLSPSNAYLQYILLDLLQGYFIIKLLVPSAFVFHLSPHTCIYLNVSFNCYSSLTSNYRIFTGFYASRW